MFITSKEAGISIQGAEINSGWSEIEAKFKIPNLRYIEEFFSLKCATDLMELKVFPNVKEITEAMALYNAAKRKSRFRLSDESVAGVVIGDGNTPRLAALCAFRSKWQMFSFDPRFKSTFRYDKINRVKAVSSVWDAQVMDLFFNHTLPKEYPNVKKIIFFFPHSHCKSDFLVDLPLEYEYCVITMPCCVEFKLPKVAMYVKQPDVSYSDWGVWSEKRNIYCFTNYHLWLRSVRGICEGSFEDA